MTSIFRYFLCVIAVLFGAVGVVSAQTQLPADFVKDIDRAAVTFQQDADNRNSTHVVTNQSARADMWRQQVVKNIVLQHWERHPDKYAAIVSYTHSKFPWYQHESNLGGETYSAATSTDVVAGQQLYPSSHYVQPALTPYAHGYSGSANYAAPNISQDVSTDLGIKNGQEDHYPVVVYDPLEPMNRGIFYFNAKFDQYVFIPIVDVYKFITPDLVETGVHNVFENLSEILSFGNELLQFSFIDASKTALRFGINSTIGLAGIFDPATHMGLPQDKEDFGQTLGSWGIPEGPYIVLPIFGPSNLRDTTGLIADTAAFAALDPFTISSTKNDYPAIYALQSVDKRNSIDYRYHMSGTPFEYETVRYLMTMKRRLDIQR